MNRCWKMAESMFFITMLLMLSTPSFAQSGTKTELTVNNASGLGRRAAGASANSISPAAPSASGFSTLDACTFFTGGRLCISPEAKGIPGQTLTLYGIKAMTPNSTLSLVWTSGTDQTTSSFTVSCVADSDGSFSCDFVVPPLNKGSHPVKLRDSTGFERNLPTFFINAGIYSSQTTVPPMTTITVYGGGYLPTSAIKLLRDGNLLSIYGVFFPDDHGSFSKEVVIPGPNGDHTITAVDLNGFVDDQTIHITVDDGSRITLAETSGVAGTTAHVNGSGFSSKNTSVVPVTITFNGVTVTTCNATSGSFSNCPYTVPNLTPGDYPVHAQATVVDKAGNTVTLNADASFTLFPALDIKVSPNPITPTSNLTIIGINFQKGVNLGILLDGNVVAPGPDGKSCKADANGEITSGSGTGPCYIVIDRMTQPGNHTLTVSDGRGQAQTTVTVTSAITLTQTSGPVGTTGTISGIGFGGNQQLPLTGSITTGPNTTADFPLGTCKTDGANSFSCGFTVPAAPTGQQTVTVTDATNSASAAFTITPSVSLANASGTVGATNTLNGAGFGANQSVTATYQGANLTFSGACSTDARGSFSCGFTVPAGVAGVKTVQAKDALSHSASTTFTLNTNLTFAHSAATIGSANTLWGSGFSASKSVTATFGGAALTFAQACNTDALGSFSCDFTVPAATDGPQTVQATDAAGLSTSATFTVLAPDLTITKTHTGNFTRGGTGQTYTITVTNSGTYPSSGMVTVTDTLPAGLTATGISGTFWTCNLGQLSCQTNRVLSPGASFQPITVTVSVAPYAPVTLTNTATVSGGGDADTTNNTANDVTIVDCASAITVTSNAASGAGSLRQALGFVCDGGTITFDLTKFNSPITLTSELLINQSVTIQGPGANLLTVSGNHATRVFNITNGKSAVTANISGLTIAQGSVTNANGGGISNSATLTLTGCALDHNTVQGGGQGGGLHNTGTATITRSTISHNSAGAGGGINNIGTLTLVNSTVSGNLASSGGGLLQNNAATAATLTSSTITNNQATTNGGLWNEAGTCTLTNTIVAGNLLDDQTPSDITGTVAATSSFNLIGTGGGGGLVNQSNHNSVGVANPGLALLGHYGGPTQTHALLAGSPALNSGSRTGAGATDQRGVARPAGSLPDIGAFESTITLSPTVLPSGRVGTAYFQSFSVTGGTQPVTFSLTGTVPTGLTIADPSVPELSGTPMQAGSFPLCVVATGQDGLAGAACDTLIVEPGPVHHFTVASVSNVVTAGKPFSVIITALDVGNNQVGDFFGQVNLSTNAGTITPSSSGFFNSGELTQSVTLLQPGTGKTISVNDGSGHRGTSAILTVNPGSPSAVCSVTLGPASATVPATGGTGTILVQAALPDCQWRAASQAPWLTITAGLSGTGTSVIAYAVAANPGIGARTGTILVEDQSFTLTQPGTCDLALSPAGLPSFTPLGGQLRISVSTTGGCAWTASADASFISLSTDANGVNLIVAPNPNPVARRGTISVGGQSLTVRQAAQFSDVPQSHPLFDYISKLSAAGISAGCGDGNFCPDSAVTREQMAIFIERALGVFSPPPPPSQRFIDVPSSRPGYAYIDDFAARGITSGCGGGNYCPDASVTREQMAVFLVRALHAPGYVPAAPTQARFLDVPLSSPFAAYIEELAARGITSGCGGGNFCPAAVVTRGQMAVFLVKAFGL